MKSNSITLTADEKGTKHEVYVYGENLESVTVVVRGFTCKMRADEFFRIIDEAFKW